MILARTIKILLALANWSMLLIELNYQRPGDSFLKALINLAKTPSEIVQITPFATFLYYSFLGLILNFALTCTFLIFKNGISISKYCLCSSFVLWVSLSCIVLYSYYLDFISYISSSIPFLTLLFLALVAVIIEYFSLKDEMR